MASLDHGWDSAAKSKDALRQHRATESRKRYGETFVPCEAVASYFSICREINNAVGGSPRLRKSRMTAKREPNN
jgi:hypothetical protein